jgi:hypothetical protein
LVLGYGYTCDDFFAAKTVKDNPELWTNGMGFINIGVCSKVQKSVAADCCGCCGGFASELKQVFLYIFILVTAVQ